MNEKKLSNVLTTAFGIPVADYQNSLKADTGFYTQKMVRHFSGILQVPIVIKINR
jgi:hypothetical protein